MLALVLYGVDPADFDLGPDDVPPAIDLRAVRALATPSPGWFTEAEQERAAA